MRNEAVRQRVQKAGREVVVFDKASHICGFGNGLHDGPVHSSWRPWSMRGVYDCGPVVIHVGRMMDVDVRTVAGRRLLAIQLCM